MSIDVIAHTEFSKHKLLECDLAADPFSQFQSWLNDVQGANVSDWQAMLSLRTAADEQGEVLGVGQSMSALARIAGPLLGVWLFKLDKQHPENSVALPYWAGAGLMLLGVVMVLSLRRQPTRCSETQA